jgi:fatty acyl-CoA reductase
VISALHEPFPGWVGNCNGPIGFMFGVCKGFVHTLFGDPNAKVDYMPVDICIQFMLIASWYKATSG